MAAKNVKFFYDVVSPYSWIGFEVITRYATCWNINLHLKPFFLGAVMQHTNNLPPGLVPAKATYMTKDLTRLSMHYGVPIKFPADFAKVAFEKGTLQADRFLTAVSLLQPLNLAEVSRQMWLRVWSRDEDILDPESLKSAGLAGGLSEQEVSECLKIMNTEPVKLELKNSTQEAISKGAFGAPYFLLETQTGEEGVFGSDRFHIIADLLGERYVGPLNELSELPNAQAKQHKL